MSLSVLSARFRFVLLCAAGVLSLFSNAHASVWQDGFSLSVKPDDRLSLMYSPFTQHFSHSEEHRYVWMVGEERERANGRLSGITYFANSFGQPSAYLYPWGQSFRNLGGVQGLYAKWSGGLLYGYVEPYENKVPLNVKGFSPAIIPSLGMERRGYGAQINLLGTAGFMLQFNIPLGH